MQKSGFLNRNKTYMQSFNWNTDFSGSTFRVFGKHHNWFDNSIWKPISANFSEDSGRFSANNLPFNYSVPFLATGSAFFENSQSWDIFSKSRISESPVVFEFVPEGASPVEGVINPLNPSQIFYKNAYGEGISYRYTVWHGKAPRATWEIVVESPPSQDVVISRLIKCSDVRTYVRNIDGQIVRPWTGNSGDTALVQGFGIILRKGTSEDNVSLIRGSGIKAPKAWYYSSDGTYHETYITVRFDVLSSDTVRATKTIPKSFCDAAFDAGANSVMADDTFTVYPDYNTEVTSVDGFSQRFSGVSDWATIQSGDGTYALDSTARIEIYLSTWYGAGQWHTLNRGHLLFDTSILSGKTVSSATLAMTPTGGRSNTLNSTWGISLCSSNPASNTAIVASDHQNVGSTRFSDTDVAHANPMTGLKTWLLNSSGLSAIDVDGISKFALRHNKDLENVENFSGTGRTDYVYFYSADQSGTSSDPYLEIEASEASEEEPDFICFSSCFRGSFSGNLRGAVYR